MLKSPPLVIDSLFKSNLFFFS